MLCGGRRVSTGLQSGCSRPPMARMPATCYGPKRRAVENARSGRKPNAGEGM